MPNPTLDPSAALDQSTRGWKATGWFGVGWFALFLIGGIIIQGEPPAYDQPVAAARDFFITRSDRYLLGDYISGLAFILGFVPFIVGLARLLYLAEPQPRIASTIVLAGGLTTVAVGDAATAFLDAVALGNAATDLADTTLQGFLHSNAVAIAAIGLPMALTALASAYVIWTTRVLWRWLAPIAALSGALHIIGALFILPDDFSGYPLSRDSIKPDNECISHPAIEPKSHKRQVNRRHAARSVRVRDRSRLVRAPGGLVQCV